MEIMWLIWVTYLLPAVVLSLPFWVFGRKRAKWQRWEIISILILPCLVWIILTLLGLKPKSLANLVEPGYLGFLVPLGAILRVAFGPKINPELGAMAAVVFCCTLAVVLYGLFPVLPE